MSDKKLKLLAQFNAERQAVHHAIERVGIPSGIACPKCGGEFNEQPNMTLTVNPPRIPLICPACGNRDTRLV